MTGVDSGPLRRVALLAFVLVATAAATQLLTNAMGADGLSVPEIGILPLFALTFGWICYAFATALVGFVLHLVGEPGGAPGDRLRPPGNGPSTARTALVMPIYHEDPVRVAARLTAVYRSLADTGQLAEFDLFILSDSRKRDVVQAEQAMWARAVRRARRRRPAVLSQARRERGPQGRQHRRLLPQLGAPAIAISSCSTPTA